MSDCANKKPSVGGQAVIEGVMMRSPYKIATAVRNPEGEIIVKTRDFISLTKKNKLMGLPIVRGTVSLIEMLSIGIDTINWSADIAYPPEKKEFASEVKEKRHKAKEKAGEALSMVFAFALAFVLFAWLPLFVAQLLGFKDNPVVFNLVAGAIRVFVFVIYLLVISLFKDVRRLFMYHGAEHKAIYTFENGIDLTTENVSKFTTLHPRCGTSFILIVAILSIIFFAISDSLFAFVTGSAPTLLVRLLYHLALWPLMTGISFETLKLSDKLSAKSRFFKLFVMPGLWLQLITTKDPDTGQIEVAIAAINASLAVEDKDAS